jgi:hypothetical protein
LCVDYGETLAWKKNNVGRHKTAPAAALLRRWADFSAPVTLQ